MDQGLSSAACAHSSLTSLFSQKEPQPRGGDGCRRPGSGRPRCGGRLGSCGPPGPKSITSSFPPGARPLPDGACAGAAGGGRGGGSPPRVPPFSRLARVAALSAGGGAERKALRMRRGAARCPPAPSRQPRRPRGPGQGRGRRPEPR